MRSDLRQQLVQVQRLQEAGKAQKQHQEAALKQAQEEVLEAVQQGNHKYAAMLAERMSIEDELKHQLASKQQAAARRSAGQLFVRDDNCCAVVLASNDVHFFNFLVVPDYPKLPHRRSVMLIHVFRDSGCFQMSEYAVP